MRKSIKRIMVLLTSITLSVSGISYVKDVKAQTSEEVWKSEAVQVPSEGQLVGAGYINVEFDNSMKDYTYTVYLDGQEMYWNGNNIVRSELGEEKTNESVTKTFTSDDEGKTEVYTNKVSKHEIVIKAKKDNKEIVSDTRTFYVSKKGLALGGDMSDKIKLNKLNCSWYYNWSTEAFNNQLDEGVAHVPMMWGDGDDNKEAIQTMNTSSNYILGFNEPDIEKQANMSFFEGVDVWNEYIKPLNMRKVSPAPAAPGGDSKWLRLFMSGGYICKNPWDGSWGLYDDYEDEATKTWVDGESNSVDAVVLHYYRNQINLQGLIDAVNTLWNQYHKPIWITEMSLFGIKGTYTDFSYELPEKRKAIQDYLKGVVENLDNIPYVERYCWFPYDIDSTNDIDAFNGSGGTAMFDYKSGAYTELGKMYSTIGNPEGYVGQSISENEMYIHPSDLETSNQETTNVESKTTEKPTEAITTQNESKADIKKTNTTKTRITKISKIKKKKVKVEWKKVKSAKKYQIQYSMNKKFTKKVKIKTTKKINIVITKLQNKKYYFRVRTVNTLGNGKWSTVKSVLVK